MSTPRLTDLTLDDLWLLFRDKVRALIQDELREAAEPHDLKSSDLSDFPVDSYGTWPDDLSLRREGMYGDDER